MDAMRKPVWEQPTPLYGNIADTGEIVVRAVMDYAESRDDRGHRIWDAGWIQLAVEVWTSVPIGKEQQRGHCMERGFPAPLSESKYENVYRDVLDTYEQYWKDRGINPDPEWKRKLAEACGKAAQRFARASSAAVLAAH